VAEVSPRWLQVGWDVFNVAKGVSEVFQRHSRGKKGVLGVTR
jgi:hypothetical protein